MSTTTRRNSCLWEFSLTRRKAMELREGHDGRLESPKQVCTILRDLGVHELEQEHFLAFFLDVKHRVRGFSTVSVGLIDRSQVHPREVFRNAILNGSSRVILAHNHPSNDPTPSAQDIDCTRQLVEAGKIIGIEVLDHVIIGDGESAGRRYVSFREEGLL